MHKITGQMDFPPKLVVFVSPHPTPTCLMNSSEMFSCGAHPWFNGELWSRGAASKEVPWSLSKNLGELGVDKDANIQKWIWVQ